MRSATALRRATQESVGRRLLQLGILLFFLGLLTGFAVPLAANPRMALSSHLEGVLNGLFLLVLGIIWGRLQLGRGTERVTFGLLVYGTFANWGTTLVAALWGAGETMMPLAAAGYAGTSAQEMLIVFGLLSLSFAMLVVCPVVLWGLRPQEVDEVVEPDGAGRKLPRARPQEG